MTTPVNTTNTVTQPHESSVHALLALGLAQQGALNGRSVQDQGQQFGRVADRLANDPGFETVAAETAAEYLKTQAMHGDHFWARFGLRGGTYLALLPVLLLFAVTKGQQDELLAGLGLVLAICAFLAGHYADRIQTDLKTAESLLKAAIKRRGQLQQAALVPVALDLDLDAVERRVSQQHLLVRWIVMFALLTFVVIGCAAYLQVRSAGGSAA